MRQPGVVTRVLLLALLAITGIVGMLLAQTKALDTALFAVAVVPLVYGARCCWARRQ